MTSSRPDCRRKLRDTSWVANEGANETLRYMLDAVDPRAQQRTQHETDSQDAA